MRVHRFIGKFNLSSSKLMVKDEELINQIRNVLRLEKGEEILLGDGNLNEAKARIIEIGKNFIDLEILERQKNDNEPKRKVILYCAVLKRENFELVVQKATEAGIKEIIPIITERTVKLNIRRDRIEKIIREASEQSGRGFLPVLHETVNLEKALEIAKDNQLNIVFDQSGLPYGRESFDDNERLDNTGQIGVWIGPEGGWTNKEIDLAKESSFKIINLGKLTLRAETAAIVATYIVVHNLNCR